MCLRTTGILTAAVPFRQVCTSPENERAAARSFRNRMPRVHLSGTSTMLPEFRHFERMSTTEINA
jgi:N-methylhydantoinase A/oxoprolinase/acetone carboxylase beta subunit